MSKRDMKIVPEIIDFIKNIDNKTIREKMDNEYKAFTNKYEQLNKSNASYPNFHYYSMTVQYIFFSTFFSTVITNLKEALNTIQQESITYKNECFMTFYRLMWLADEIGTKLKAIDHYYIYDEKCVKEQELDKQKRDELLIEYAKYGMTFTDKPSYRQLKKYNDMYEDRKKEAKQ